MPITAYKVYWDGENPTSETYTLAASLAEDTLEYTNNDVVAGLVYKFKVVA